MRLLSAGLGGSFAVFTQTLPAYGRNFLRGLAQKPETMATNTNSQHNEGPVARTIEEQTARLPSDTFLWVAVGSMAVSLGLQLFGRSKAAMFVGQWAPSLLIMGLYNKLVKLEGHDGQDSGSEERTGRVEQKIRRTVNA